MTTTAYDRGLIGITAGERPPGSASRERVRRDLASRGCLDRVAGYEIFTPPLAPSRVS